jgi:hypothetical protein
VRPTTRAAPLVRRAQNQLNQMAKQKLCWICQSPDHVKAQCPQAQQAIQEQLNAIESLGQNSGDDNNEETLTEHLNALSLLLDDEDDEENEGQ